MRNRVVVAAVSVFLVVAAGAPNAQANVNKVTFQRLIVLQALNMCALQFMITAVVDNKTNGSEAVTVNGQKIAGIAQVAATGKALANHPILAASPAFAAFTNETPDETISDADCEKLTANTWIDFRGSFGPSAGTATIPADFGINKAALWDTNNQVADLTLNSVQLGTFGASTITVGGGILIGGTPGPGAGGGGGGCSFMPASPGTGVGLGACALILGAVAARGRRRRR